ncbi:hypothetical protein D5086_001359 [Populus alba]|uniref:Uncharacterized protein n=1 Tax=Populus alba TaxID=43335 RepID=A0ACC4CZ61_POPAL
MLVLRELQKSPRLCRQGHNRSMLKGSRNMVHRVFWEESQQKRLETPFIELKESIYDWNGNSNASVHGTQIFGDSGGLSEEGFQSENHHLFSIPDLEESDRYREKCCVLPFEQVAISTPLPKKSGSKRPRNGMDQNKRPVKKPKRKKHRTKVAVEGKPKRTPKKMPKLATPKCMQETEEKRKCVEKDAPPKCMQDTKEKRKCVEKAPPPLRNSEESSVREHHKEVAEIPKMENLPVDDNKMAMPGMDNKSGSMVLLSDDKLGFKSNENELRWNVRAMRFAEKEEDLVTAPREHIPVPGEQEFQITDKLNGENRETLAEGCVEEGLSLKQALTNEVNGVQIVFCEAKAPSCSEMRPSAAKSKFEDGKSKQQSRKKKIRITDKSIKPGPKLFDDESGILLKTVKHAVMDKLGGLLRNSSINDNKSEKRGPGRPKSKPEHVVDGQNALIPCWGHGRARHEVDLEPESLRRWNQLMKIDSGEGEEEDGRRKEWWQREKITFNGRIDAFTSRSHQFLGETPNSSQQPEKLCSSQGSQLCDQKTCFACEGIVRGTILVFADHKSSYDPIIVPRELLWNHVKRTLYVGSSTKSIFRDLSLKEIHQNFWTGFTCVKAFERGTGAPKPLARRFHCSASKMEKKGRKKSGAVKDDAKAITLKNAL